MLSLETHYLGHVALRSLNGGNNMQDISRGHILAAENESAQGRYIISQPDTVPTRIVLDALKKRFPHYKFLDGKDEEPQPLLDNTKVATTSGCMQCNSSMLRSYL